MSIDLSKFDRETVAEIIKIMRKRRPTQKDQARLAALVKGTARTGNPVVYLMGVGDSLKIGFTKFIKNRVRQMQTYHSEAIVLYATIPGSKELEQKLHRKFAHHHLRGELFRKDQEIIDFFQHQQTVGVIEDYFADKNT